MEPLLPWGLEIIHSIQHIQSPLLNTFFLFITSLGSSLAFLVVLPLLFWCVDYNLGMRVAIVCTLSAFCNFSLKDFFAQPRPFNLDPSVAITTAEDTGCRVVMPRDPSSYGAALPPGPERNGCGL